MNREDNDRCGHGVIVIENAGRWLHPMALDVCDRPPSPTRDGGR